MAKGKPVTQDEIAAALEPLLELMDHLRDMTKRLDNGHAGEIPNALDHVRTIAAASRDLNDFSLRLLAEQRAAEVRSKIAAAETRTQQD